MDLMPNLSEYTDIKKKIINLIVHDRECVDLISNTTGKTLPAADLIQTSKSVNQIHPYDFMPGSTEQAECHVGVEVYDDKIINNAVARYEVDILIFVPTVLMVMDGGVRRDAIAAAIDRLINNNLSLGIGEVRRIPGACKEPMDGYRLRILRYRVGNYNNLGETLNAFRYD
jgi:hypothetical protein|nr:MAG TPA: hypothetical protein [Caudoviricetes sp.]